MKKYFTLMIKNLYFKITLQRKIKTREFVKFQTKKDGDVN